MKNLFIIMLFPTLMFGQINASLFSGSNSPYDSHSSLESDLLNAISFHNTIRNYQLSPVLNYDYDLSLSAQQWANTIIRTGEFDFDPSVPAYIGENLYRGEISDANNIANYNPYLDAALYWATNRTGDGVSYQNMCLQEFGSIGMGVAYGNGKVVVVAKYE